MRQACGATATVERNGLLYCAYHDPEPEKRKKEIEIKRDVDKAEKERVAAEKDRRIWAEATAFADSQGIKVYLVREDVLNVIVGHLSTLPYGNVHELIRIIEALPEAPFAGRGRVMEEQDREV